MPYRLDCKQLALAKNYLLPKVEPGGAWWDESDTETCYEKQRQCFYNLKEGCKSFEEFNTWVHTHLSCEQVRQLYQYIYQQMDDESS